MWKSPIRYAAQRSTAGSIALQGLPTRPELDEVRLPLLNILVWLHRMSVGHVRAMAVSVAIGRRRRSE